ncbi:MAG TPA: cysteine--tRNA ligase [Candidatus Methylacidiphilales bacterium]|nr:cysteine--tRNA ligase [Candidatus Methylacidiphilales bacterium]
MSRPALRLFNTLTRAVEPLVPLDPAGQRVSLYVCGPTIYDHGHIGNFRTYVAVDLLRRTLGHFGYQTDHVMNFTDVDDKTIRGAREKNIPLREFTAIYREAFLEDMKTLHIEIPERTPNATGSIPSMRDLIQKLIDKKAAYVSDDGSVYFRIASFPKYGCLCHLDLGNLMSGARVNQDEYEKEGAGDFVLWKKWIPSDGEVGWDSPWGKGRPGWHIECSALSMEHLGPQIDIHGGGVDLCFPHHENEIAQSESATGKPFVRHWFHVEHLLVDGQKMSKSLGNMHTVRDVLARGYTGRELRYALLSGAHYSKNLNFTWQGMDDARTALARIDEWRKRIKELAGLATASDKEMISPNLAQTIDAIIADNLNVADLLGHLFIWIRAANKSFDAGQLTPAQAYAYNQAWAAFDAILGLGGAVISIPAEVQALLDQRAEARQTKNFSLSDELRKKIEALGWKVKDTAKGQEALPG